MQNNISPITKTIMESLDSFVEEGANLEHDRWARWQKHMFSKMYEDKTADGKPTGCMVLPEEFVERWFRQIDTPYSDLSEQEKESDRKETRNYIPHLLQSQILLLEAVQQQLRDSQWECPEHGLPEFSLIECLECKNALSINVILLDQISSLYETLEFLKKSL